MGRFVVFIVLAMYATMVQARPLEVRPIDFGVVETAAEPSIAVDGNGGFVLTWQARLDRGETALRYRRIDAHGKSGASGEIVSGQGWFANWADFPALVVLDNGDWLAHWLQRSGAGHAYDIRMTRSRDAGKSWDEPFILHDDNTRSEHGFVAFAPVATDVARVVWLDGRHTTAALAHDGHAHHQGGTAMSLRSAIVGRGGVTASEQIDDRVCDCCQTDSVRIGRQALVVYRDRSADEIRDVKFLRHDGERWHEAMSVFDEKWRIAGCPVNGPAIAAQGERVIVAGYSEAGGVPAIRVRSSSDAGRHWHDVVRLPGADTLGRLDAVALGAGGFAVSRLDEVDGQVELRLSLHDDTGAVLRTHTLATLPSGRLTGFPRMAASGDTILIAWTQPEDGKPRIRAALIGIGSPDS